MDAEEKRIHAILGDDCARTTRIAMRYLEYLRKHLVLPIIVTGREDFPWEEPYVFGGWSKREYEKLKKTNPSYTDTFEIQLLDSPNGYEDIVVKARRVSDGKVFAIGLSWLRCENKDSEAFTIVDDYGFWHTNY